MLLERRALVVLAALAVAAPASVLALGGRGLVVYVLAWVLALPQLLPELRSLLRTEQAGVLFVFLTACSADYVDQAFEVEQRVTLLLVLLSLGYLVARRQTASQLLRSAPLFTLAIFFAQQTVSAALLNPDELWLVASGRASMLAAALAGAVLARQPDGRRAVPVLILLGGLVSVPVMVHEIISPDLVLFPSQPVQREVRAGGLFAQPNNVGAALSFSAAFLLVLLDRAQLRRRTAVILGAVIAVGLVACSSRAALLIVAILGAIAAIAAFYRRVGRVPVASGFILVGLLAVSLPPLGRALGQLSERLEDVGPLPTSRLGEVALALSGDPEELEDDDSSRTKLALEAWRLIRERPLFGRGTHNFAVERGPEGRRSHVELLDVLGENGVVGGALYAAFIFTLVLAVARVRDEDRLGAALVLAAWLFTGLHKHNVLEYRFMVLPLSWICGITQAAPTRAPVSAPR